MRRKNMLVLVLGGCDSHATEGSGNPFVELTDIKHTSATGRNNDETSLPQGLNSDVISRINAVFTSRLTGYP